MKEIQAPFGFYQFLDRPSVFLAGSIEMGSATDWQRQIIGFLKNENVLILNPRRNDWDSSLEQSIRNSKFREQVEWELEAMEKANVIAMFFDPATKSPIALLELGLHAKSGKLIVCCPENFWRKGNVDIICSKYNIKQVNTLGELAEEIKHWATSNHFHGK